MLNQLLDEKGIVGLVIGGGNYVSLFVLLVLLLMSSLSWAIIVLKALQFRKTDLENQTFLKLFWKSTGLQCR